MFTPFELQYMKMQVSLPIAPEDPQAVVKMQLATSCLKKLNDMTAAPPPIVEQPVVDEAITAKRSKVKNGDAVAAAG